MTEGGECIKSLKYAKNRRHFYVVVIIYVDIFALPLLTFAPAASDPETNVRLSRPFCSSRYGCTIP